LNGTRTCGTPGITDITLCRPKNDDGSVWVSGTLDPTKNTRAYTMNYYVSQLQAVRPNMRVYAATADGSTCMGYPSFDGSRYKTLTSAIGGWNYNICGASSTSTAMAQVFTNLRSELQVRIQAFRTKLIMVEQQPDLSTVKIVKYPSGNRNAPITLNQISSSSAQTSVNGWTYIGRIENRATMETSELPPAPMNYASGYAIELKGSAVLEGSDTLEISYKPSYSASAAAAK
jgi:hypothetical protein